VSLAQALAALWAFGGLLLAWMVAYKLAGYGVKNSGFYVDPLHDPLLFASDLLRAIPIYLASQFTLPFAAAAAMHPLAGPIATAISLAVLYASRKLWLPWVKEDSRARALGLGALLAILPLGSTIPQDRLVSFIALGVCGLLALIVEERLGSPNRLPQRGALRLFRLHAVWAPILYVPYLFGSMTMISGGGGVVLDRVLGTDQRPVLLVNAPSYLPVHFFAKKRAWFGESQPAVDVLYAGMAELELTRSAERSLELAADGGYFAGRLERLERDPRRHPLQVGEVVQVSRLRAQVLEVKDGLPTRVRFDFVQPLSDARVYAWQGRSLEPLLLPQIGAHVHIHAASAM
jgi:hypothetical protein